MYRAQQRKTKGLGEGTGEGKRPTKLQSNLLTDWVFKKDVGKSIEHAGGLSERVGVSYHQQLLGITWKGGKPIRRGRRHRSTSKGRKTSWRGLDRNTPKTSTLSQKKKIEGREKKGPFRNASAVSKWESNNSSRDWKVKKGGGA